MATQSRNVDAQTRDRMYPMAGGELVLERGDTGVHLAATTFECGGVQAVDLILALAEARELHAKLGAQLGYDPACPGCTYDGHQDSCAPAHTCGGAR